jgi:hypothetical protein
MIVLAKGYGRAILSGAVLLLSCDLGRSEPKPMSDKVSGSIQVFGLATGVVLVGPGGEYDAANGPSNRHGIPGCVRDVSQDNQETGEEPDLGVYVDFILHDSESGHYTLWIAASRPDTVTIEVQRFSLGTVVQCAAGLKEQVLVAGKRYRVDVDIANPAVVSKCGIRLGPLTEARWPRRFRSLLP